MRRRSLLVVAGIAVSVLVLLVLWTGAWGTVVGPQSYERTTVTVLDSETGSVLTTVAVRVADTRRKRYVGLSDTASLGPGEGMLFVHDADGRHTYVMRDMDFALDIVFADRTGTITQIHHASVPPPGTSAGERARYVGRGRYVLEVRRGWANESGVDTGDTLRSPVVGD